MDNGEHISDMVDTLLAGLEHISRQSKKKENSELVRTTAILVLKLALTNTLISLY